MVLKSGWDLKMAKEKRSEDTRQRGLCSNEEKWEERGQQGFRIQEGDEKHTGTYFKTRSEVQEEVQETAQRAFGSRKDSLSYFETSLDSFYWLEYVLPTQTGFIKKQCRNLESRILKT